VPVTTPIYTAASYAYDSMEQLDRIFDLQEAGPSYARYDNPTRKRARRGDAGTRKRHGSHCVRLGHDRDSYGTAGGAARSAEASARGEHNVRATTAMLTKIFDPLGVETTQVDPCDLMRSSRR